MQKRNNPPLAPGDDRELSKSATKKDKEKGNVTEVTALSYDEVGPS